ncbi:sensor domain-containing diguanylate cyclase [Roseomonas sp. 18066]|uniref:GGDEF domain-containing protein n=1 Tax=Roseomonas sp. 18066 TaxID=2681412 RepID=UPI00135C6B6E|nr:sensor domain-containing diguanylate cyclase [Roseomonas sp. 18066]
MLQDARTVSVPLRATRRLANWLVISGLIVALGTLLVGAAVLSDARRDAWLRAEQASMNLAMALERDITRSLAAYDLSLQGAAVAMEQPDLSASSPEIRQMALFDRAASARQFGALLVLNAEGKVVASSANPSPEERDLSDRDFFQVHKQQPDRGLYIGRPFVASAAPNDLRVAVSRRLPLNRSLFGGIVVGSLRLTDFQDLFARLDLGAQGAITLFQDDGHILVRRSSAAGESNRDLSGADTVRRFMAAPSGSFTGIAALDGVERLYTFRHVGDYPLILSIARSVDDIYAAWWRKTAVIACILLLLCVSMVALCVMFRLEILRRLQAEMTLAETAAKFERLSHLDGLTGLANRAKFDLTLARNWDHAARHRLPLSLVMLDADCFKSYNDRYGHQEGDQVLRAVGRCIQAAATRPEDTGARYGGEEFAILLPGTGTSGAFLVAEKIRASVASTAMPHACNPSGQVTISAGVAVIWPDRLTPPGQLVAMADQALYAAKHAGRNRVEVGLSAGASGSGRLAA